MRPFRNLPLKRKLTLISMLTSGAAMLLTCAVILAYERVSFRRAIVGQVLTTARMVADNSAAALTFDDPASAEQTLRSFSAEPHTVAAVIYNGAGQPFARYQAPGTPPWTPPPVEQNIYRIRDGHLDLFSKISVAGEVIGTVYVRHDMVALRENLQRFGWLMLAVLVVASLVALLLTSQLQPLVSGPILDLAEVVRDVARRKNFAVRARKQGEDEVGRLIDGFNEMLHQIQVRESALQAAHEELEKRVAERTEELASSLSVLNATLDSTADGILALSLDSRLLCHNARFVEMWRIPAEMIARQRKDELIGFLASQVTQPERFLARIGELYRAPEAESVEVLVLLDGRSFERSVRPQRMGGRAVGVVINYRDITARLRSEEQLENVHRQLLETSRQAGMAEVATGVLHNVGNVLNSVNVSATLVEESVRKSNIANLGRVVNLLDEHAADLGAFVTESRQGRSLPEYLRQLHERLLREQQTILTEAASLRENVGHIKDIVAMQQEYAKVSGVVEVLQVADLVEDSLRMNAAALVRHGVTVERDYQPLPPVALEKHKTLQILVNLIRNAKYACDESGRSDKRLTMRIVPEAGRVLISVRDNGVGISTENLTRIFNHGFTTRRDGHGFGLHSGALAATEMGGALRVHSDGPGCGATFTLELPATATK